MCEDHIRVITVDDHEIVRLGIRIAMDTLCDIKLAGEATNGSEAIELYERLHPDVVLMDLKMPVMDGVVASRMIRSKHPEARIIALTTFTDELLVRSALDAGITSYLLKNVTIDELSRAIRDAYHRRPTWSSGAAEALIRAATAPAQTHTLTPSELLVLRHLAEGLSNIQIASQLNISVSTVKKHVSSVLSKLGVHNRAEAAAWAVRNVLNEQEEQN